MDANSLEKNLFSYQWVAARSEFRGLTAIWARGIWTFTRLRLWPSVTVPKSATSIFVSYPTWYKCRCWLLRMRLLIYRRKSRWLTRYLYCRVHGWTDRRLIRCHSCLVHRWIRYRIAADIYITIFLLCVILLLLTKATMYQFPPSITFLLGVFCLQFASQVGIHILYTLCFVQIRVHLSLFSLKLLMQLPVLIPLQAVVIIL